MQGALPPDLSRRTARHQQDIPGLPDESVRGDVPVRKLLGLERDVKSFGLPRPDGGAPESRQLSFGPFDLRVRIVDVNLHDLRAFSIARVFDIQAHRDAALPSFRLGA